MHRRREDFRDRHYPPPKLYRIEYIKRKYRLKSDRDQAPLIAPSPKRPVQGIASISLLVHVLLSKYVDHRVPRARMSNMAAYSCATVQLMRNVAPRERPTEAVFKSPLAAEVKSFGREHKGKRPKIIGQMSDREMNESEPSMRCRNVSMIRSKPEEGGCSGISREEVCIADPMACGMKVA